MKIHRRDLRRPAQNEASRSWYRIQNATTATEPTTVYLYGIVGEDWWGDGNPAAQLVKDINALDVSEIQLHINSPGGDVYEGLAILNALRQHKARVIVTVDGLAASAASFIAMAGDEVVMARNSELMIHDAWGICIGPAEDMTRTGADLNRISDNIASIYADRASGTDTAAFRALMLAETWFSAQEAVDAGLADRVLEKPVDEAKKNAFDLSVFDYAGRASAPAPQIPTAASAAVVTPPAAAASEDTTTQEGPSAVEISDEQMTTLRQRAGVADGADFDTCVAALGEALEEQAAPAATIPDGMVLMDSTQQQHLLADAAAGREARNQQQLEQREGLVNAAVRDGRIAPARREHWLNALTADPEGTEQLLGNLAPGLVPMDSLGHAGHEPVTVSADERLYDNVWPSATKEV